LDRCKLRSALDVLRVAKRRPKALFGSAPVRRRASKRRRMKRYVSLGNRFAL